MNLKNNTELIIIDYEYAGWNPMAMDLANYLNECILDNAYPADNGIALFPENMMTEPEIERMAKVYMERYFNQYADKALVDKYSNNA